MTPDLLWTPVCVVSTPLLIQLSDSGLRKAANDSPSVWGPATHMGVSNEAPGSRHQPGHCSFLGSEPEDGGSGANALQAF